jgi:hypothetical protein
MRRVCILLSALALAGCGTAQSFQADEQAKQLAVRNADLVARSDTAKVSCDTQYPAGNPKIAIARRKCLNDAFAIKMPIFGPDQDLAQAFMAEDMAVAEQVQAGKITIARGNAIVAGKWSQAVSESQQRANARNSVTAQQMGAGAVARQ